MTSLYLGNPSEQVRSFIVEHYGEQAYTASSKTVFKYSPSSSLPDYEQKIVGRLLMNGIPHQDEITQIYLGTTVGIIPSQSFVDCTKLNVIAIPSNVIDINENAFQNCTSLESIVFVGRTQYDVEHMIGYPWGSANYITTYNVASQEWVKQQGYITDADIELTGYYPKNQTSSNAELSTKFDTLSTYAQISRQLSIDGYLTAIPSGLSTYTQISSQLLTNGFLTNNSITTGTSNGQIKVGNTNINVKGLSSAAYTLSSAYSLSGHTHNNYALSDHTHNNYALSDHNHNNVYLPKNTKLANKDLSSNISKSDLLSTLGIQTAAYKLSTDFALTGHTHNNYSLSNHTHNNYVLSSRIIAGKQLSEDVTASDISNAINLSNYALKSQTSSTSELCTKFDSLSTYAQTKQQLSSDGYALTTQLSTIAQISSAIHLSDYVLTSDGPSYIVVADQSVTEEKIVGEIPTSKLKDSSISPSKLANGSVTGNKLSATQTIAAQKIADNSIATSKIADTALSGSHFSGNIGGTKIASNSINTSKITDAVLSGSHFSGNIGGTKIASNSVSTDKIASNALSGSHFSGNVSANKVANGSIAYDKIADSSITFSKLSSVGSISTNQLVNGIIQYSKISNNAVTYNKLSSAGTITGSQLADGSIQYAKIDNNAITYSKLSNNGTISNSQLANESIQINRIANNAVTSNKLSSTGTITGSQLADNSIATSKIGANQISARHINGSVTGSQLADGIITDAKLENSLYQKINNATTYANVISSLSSDGYVLSSRTIAGKQLSSNITKADLQTALGLSSAAYTLSSAYATSGHNHNNYALSSRQIAGKYLSNDITVNDLSTALSVNKYLTAIPNTYKKYDDTLSSLSSTSNGYYPKSQTSSNTELNTKFNTLSTYQQISSQLKNNGYLTAIPSGLSTYTQISSQLQKNGLSTYTSVKKQLSSDGYINSSVEQTITGSKSFQKNIRLSSNLSIGNIAYTEKTGVGLTFYGLCCNTSAFTTSTIGNIIPKTLAGNNTHTLNINAYDAKSESTSELVLGVNSNDKNRYASILGNALSINKLNDNNVSVYTVTPPLSANDLRIATTNWTNTQINDVVFDKSFNEYHYNDRQFYKSVKFFDPISYRVVDQNETITSATYNNNYEALFKYLSSDAGGRIDFDLGNKFSRIVPTNCSIFKDFNDNPLLGVYLNYSAGKSVQLPSSGYNQIIACYDFNTMAFKGFFIIHMPINFESSQQGFHIHKTDDNTAIYAYIFNTQSSTLSERNIYRFKLGTLTDGFYYATISNGICSPHNNTTYDQNGLLSCVYLSCSDYFMQTSGEFTYKDGYWYFMQNRNKFDTHSSRNVVICKDNPPSNDGELASLTYVTQINLPIVDLSYRYGNGYQGRSTNYATKLTHIQGIGATAKGIVEFCGGSSTAQYNSKQDQYVAKNGIRIVDYNGNHICNTLIESDKYRNTELNGGNKYTNFVDGKLDGIMKMLTTAGYTFCDQTLNSNHPAACHYIENEGGSVYDDKIYSLQFCQIRQMITKTNNVWTEKRDIRVIMLVEEMSVNKNALNLSYACNFDYALNTIFDSNKLYPACNVIINNTAVRRFKNVITGSEMTCVFDFIKLMAVCGATYCTIDTRDSNISYIYSNRGPIGSDALIRITNINGQRYSTQNYGNAIVELIGQSTTITSSGNYYDINKKWIIKYTMDYDTETSTEGIYEYHDFVIQSIVLIVPAVSATNI